MATLVDYCIVHNDHERLFLCSLLADCRQRRCKQRLPVNPFMLEKPVGARPVDKFSSRSGQHPRNSVLAQRQHRSDGQKAGFVKNPFLSEGGPGLREIILEAVD